jgi:hypothetical protein
VGEKPSFAGGQVANLIRISVIERARSRVMNDEHRTGRLCALGSRRGQRISNPRGNRLTMRLRTSSRTNASNCPAAWSNSLGEPLY